MFVSTDGYRLVRKQRADGTYYWTDGDLIFEDNRCWPVDATGKPLWCAAPPHQQPRSNHASNEQ